MTSDDLSAVLAEMLLEHRPRFDSWGDFEGCRCGWHAPDFLDKWDTREAAIERWWDDHLHAVAAGLRALQGKP